MNRRYQAFVDELPMVTRCVFCSWSFEGTALAGREAAAEHRAGLHPLARKVRRKRAEGVVNSRDPESRAEGLERARKLRESWAERGVG